ncbi:hypothetical protein [Demequina muriae]|uniref:Esterase n=1 Tax=Demequina muriae TaxID=3051664 RepID=A0ABT8GGK5_9MICO|nr:hypothetical protein [Demequina sp. EGI L300058]MDN4480558.1 hypothetical protein [Demequina sp. EGI L300058]
MHITARTHVGNRGWELDSVEISGAPAEAANEWQVLIGGEEAPLRNTVEGLVAPANSGTSYPADLRVVARSDGAVVATRADATYTRTADDFTAHENGGVRYRLRAPRAQGPRPMLVFLHGGGEAGTDGWAQLVGTLGAAHLAEAYPDFLVLAPQAPPASDLLPPPHLPFAEAALDPTTGWSRCYLAALGDVVRGLVHEGRVDRSRIYLTGVSMGGAGAIRALSVNHGLFAAALPVCPTMTPETFGILRSLVDVPLWLSSAYVDHTPYRHKYLVDAVQELQRRGSPHARLTLFAPEQLERYGFATDTSLDAEQLLAENHHAWVPAYHDEDGMLTWLVSQRSPH